MHLSWILFMKYRPLVVPEPLCWDELWDSWIISYSEDMPDQGFVRRLDLLVVQDCECLEDDSRSIKLSSAFTCITRHNARIPTSKHLQHRF